MTPQGGHTLTAIAIDNDKGSQAAIKWAADHILSPTNQCILVHVKTCDNHSYDKIAMPEKADDETKRLFLPYRAFCARKEIIAKEVVLHDLNIAIALIEFIKANTICNIVVGASNRSPFTRKFKPPDVASILCKSAPDFCSVYVIAKGKIQQARESSKKVNSTHPAQNHVSIQHFSDPQTQCQSATWGNWRSITSERSNDSLQASTNQRPVHETMNSPPVPSTGNFKVSRRYQYSSQSDGNLSSGPHSSQSSFSSGPYSSQSSTSSGPHSSQTSPKYKRLPIPNKKSPPPTYVGNLNMPCQLGFNDPSSSSDVSFTGPLSFRSYDTSSSDGLKSTECMELEAQVRRLKLELKQRENIHAAVTAQLRLPEANMSDSLCLTQTGERNESNSTLTVESKERDAAGEGPPTRFMHYKIEDIEEATKYFSASMKIGEGGFGPVYKAFFDQTPVAIKVLRPDAAQGRKQFKQEVDILGSMRHPHLVLLIGTCAEYGCLVYEYMDNGSLEDRLFRKDHTPPIPWQTRFKIAAEIATALLFLHRASPEPLVHRDLKPANILLDRNYVSKISDVGLARLVPPDVAESVTHSHMTETAGTLFYIDPEYQQTGILSVRSDVYSLGIMLLQILTAMHPVGLTVKVERAIEKGVFEEILDQSVADWKIEGALSLAKMALKCCELRKKDRPDLETVVLPELERVRDLGTIGS